jgi:hypothetical protein
MTSGDNSAGPEPTANAKAVLPQHSATTATPAVAQRLERLDFDGEACATECIDTEVTGVQAWHQRFRSWSRTACTGIR